jgi:hypothetical protein
VARRTLDVFIGADESIASSVSALEGIFIISLLVFVAMCPRHMRHDGDVVATRGCSRREDLGALRETRFVVLRRS